MVRQTNSSFYVDLLIHMLFSIFALSNSIQTVNSIFIWRQVRDDMEIIHNRSIRSVKVPDNSALYVTCKIVVLEFVHSLNYSIIKLEAWTLQDPGRFRSEASATRDPTTMLSVLFPFYT